MSVFVTADLHLSLGTDKPMDVFKGWTDYVYRLKKNWLALVEPEDTVVIVGDISWAMKLEETAEDFAFINSLPGKKIFLKGNHDYWWTTKKKMDEYLKTSGFDTISILFNNAFSAENYAICGTRGWFYDTECEQDKKVLNREVGRLNASIDEAEKFGLEPIVFLHYPPVYGEFECIEIMETLINRNIKRCYYGHLHGAASARKAITGNYKGINFNLISCDYTGFIPVIIK